MLLLCDFTKLCNWLFWTNPYAKSFCSDSHPGHSIIYGTVVMKITHWSNSGFRPLMSSSVLIATGHGGRDWMTRRHSVNIPTSAPTIWSSLRRGVRNVRKRGRDRWHRAWLFALFWRKSLHQEGRLISVISSPRQGTTTNGSWYIRTIRSCSTAHDYISFPILVLQQYSWATMLLSLHPTSSRKWKAFGLL